MHQDHTGQKQKEGQKKEKKKKKCHESGVRCQVSHVMCGMSPVTCHMSPVTNAKILKMKTSHQDKKKLKCIEKCQYKQ